MKSYRPAPQFSAAAAAVYLGATILVLAACRPSGGDAGPTATAAGPARPAGPSTVISAPENGEQFEQGQPIAVQSESMDALGISRLELLVDNRIVATGRYVPQPNAVFVARQTWTPQQPGTYTLQVQAYNAANIMARSGQVVIEVLPAQSQATPPGRPGFQIMPQPATPTILPIAPILTPTPTPTPTPSPVLPSATATPAAAYLEVSAGPGVNVRAGPGAEYPRLGVLQPGDAAVIVGQSNIGQGDWWQIQYTAAPGDLGWVQAGSGYVRAFNTGPVPVVAAPPTPAEPTATGTPTPVSTPPPVEFSVDRTRIKAGECVTVYWNVTGVKEVYYRGQGVAGENQGRRECPTVTEYYDLRVVNLDGTSQTYTLTVEVEGGGYRTIEMDEGETVDFDKDGRVTDDDGDDFEWVEENGERRFKKWDNDDDLKLVPVGPVDNLAIIRREDCEWALQNLDDQPYIKPFGALAACIQTDDGRIGKIRFQNSEEKVDIEWALW